MTFNKLANGIPLHEAAAFFLKLKTAAPDESGALEGQFTSGVDEVLAFMAEMVQNELKTQYAYLVYSQSLRDLSHFSIAEELEEHAANETEHAEFLLRRMSVLGGDIEVPDIPAPPPASDPITIIKTLIQMEQEGIANWQQLRKMVGEDNPTRFKIEEYLSTEQEHLDELWQLLPHTETASAAGTPAAPVDPQAPPPAAEPAIVGGSATAGGDPALTGQKMAAAARRMAKAANGLPDAAAGKLPAPPPPMPSLSGASAGQHAKVASKLKHAFDEMRAASTPAPGGQEANELEQYLAEEGAAQQDQNAAEEQHYRERFTDAMSRLQQAEQAQQAAEAQVQQLTEQASMSSETNQQALAQAQQIQDQAMQQVNAANASAASAMQKSLSSSNELLQQQQIAVNMRDAMQQLKSQLMGIVQSQLPPSTTMEAGVSAQQEQAAADAEAMDMAAQQAMGGQDPGGNQAGAPAASPDAGTPPGSATPGKDGPGASPTASDPSSSPAAEKKTSESSTASEKSEPAKEASDRFVGALMGGALGAGVTALENRGREGANNELRGKVKKLEAAEQAGSGGFGNAMNIAQSKMRLAAGELAQKHPHAATALGAGLGAMAGSNAAPMIRDLSNTLRG